MLFPSGPCALARRFGIPVAQDTGRTMNDPCALALGHAAWVIEEWLKVEHIEGTSFGGISTSGLANPNTNQGGELHDHNSCFTGSCEAISRHGRNSPV